MEEKCFLYLIKNRRRFLSCFGLALATPDAYGMMVVMVCPHSFHVVIASMAQLRINVESIEFQALSSSICCHSVVTKYVLFSSENCSLL